MRTAFVCFIVLAIVACSPQAPSSGDTSTATSTSNATSTTATASAGDLPAQCQSYLNSVQACLDHVSAQDASVVAQVRDTLEVNRSAIERLSHQGSPLEYCVSASNAWENRKANFGC